MIMNTGCGGNGPADPIVNAAADDPRLVAATREARERWDEFEQAFRDREEGVAYAVKFALPTPDGSTEHLWMQVTEIHDGDVTGILDNNPAQKVGYTRGDEVSVSVDSIEDWLIGRGPQDITGGFTIRVLQQIEREGP